MRRCSNGVSEKKAVMNVIKSTVETESKTFCNEMTKKNQTRLEYRYIQFVRTCLQGGHGYQLSAPCLLRLVIEEVERSLDGVATKDVNSRGPYLRVTEFHRDAYFTTCFDGVSEAQVK